MRKLIFFFFFFFTVALGGIDFAYALDPMRINIRTALSEDIETIGEAAQFYADSIFYQLVTISPAPKESREIALENLNPLSRTKDVKPVEEAILYLLRQNCNLIIDHKHKLFSFEYNKEVIQ